MRVPFIVSFSALAALASASSDLPADIGFLLNQVAGLMQTNVYYPQVAAAVQSLLDVYQLPNQQAQDEAIISSLMAALGSNNVPTAAAAIASAAISNLHDGVPTEVAGLVSSVISDMKNPAVNTQIASVIDKLIGFLNQLHIAAPELFDDNPNDSSVTSTKTTLVATNHSTATRAVSSASTPSPTSSHAPSSIGATSRSSEQGSLPSDSNNSSAHPLESSSFESSTLKTSSAQGLKPLLGYLSMGVAASVAAAFF